MVDDASADAGATKEIAERHGASFIGLSSNVGPAGATNAGLAAVHSPLVAFVDSDCVPAEGWLGPLLRPLRRPRWSPPGRREISTQAAGPARFERAGRGSLDRGPRAGPVRPGSRIPFVPDRGSCWSVPTWPTGPDLFDATLRGGEDVDLVWRLDEAGWDVRYVPASTVGARRADHAQGLPGPPGLLPGPRPTPLSRRHGKAVAPVHVSGWSLAVWGLLLARRPVLALATLGASIVLVARRLRGLVRDPVGVATHIAGGGTARSALPALASLTRAWAPAFVLGLAFRRTRRGRSPCSRRPGRARVGRRPARGHGPVRAVALALADDVAYGTGVWLGCARATDAGAAHPAGRPGGPACGRRRLCATSCRPDHGSDRSRNGLRRTRPEQSSPWRSGAARPDAPSPTPSQNADARRRWTPPRWRAAVAAPSAGQAVLGRTQQRPPEPAAALRPGPTAKR